VKPPIPLEQDSVALRILYGLVCSPWPLILWVAFRTIGSEGNSLQGFLEILGKYSPHAELFPWGSEDDEGLLEAIIFGSHDEDDGELMPDLHSWDDTDGVKVMWHDARVELFPWDDKDDLELMQRLDWPSAIHPDCWGQYMVEIPPKDWLLIRKLTWIPGSGRSNWPPYGRSRRSDTPSFDDLRIRLAALFLTYSTSTFIAPDNILAPLEISSDNSIFASMARVMNRDEEYHTTRANFESPDFWASPKLEDWLTDRSRSEELCHAVWQNIPGPSRSVFQRVESLYTLLKTLPQVSPSACTVNGPNFKTNRSWPLHHRSMGMSRVQGADFILLSLCIQGIKCYTNRTSQKVFLGCSAVQVPAAVLPECGSTRSSPLRRLC
jgi:hypothetical protein